MLYSVAFSMMEIMSLEPKSQVAGVTMIMDASGYGYKHLSSMSITDMKMTSRLTEVGKVIVPFAEPMVKIYHYINRKDFHYGSIVCI